MRIRIIWGALEIKISPEAGLRRYAFRWKIRPRDLLFIKLSRWFAIPDRFGGCCPIALKNKWQQIEWSKSDRKYHMIFHLYTKSKKNWYKWTYLQRTYLQKHIYRLREWIYGYQGGKWGDRIVGECGTDIHILLYLKWITNKDLLNSTGNSAQYYVTT